MPDSFAFAEPVDLWRPTKIVEEPIGAARRSLRSDRVVARLRSGITIEHARAELEAVAVRLAREFPVSNGGWTARVEALRDSVIGNFGQATELLLAAVVVVLLVTCLNVASLLVARAVARDREAAVRVALGAGSWRLIRLGLAEASLLSVLGASLGVLLAWLAISALKAAAPPGIPRLDAVGLDRPTFIVAGLSSVLAVVIFAIAPGRRRGEIAAALRRSAGASAGPKAQAIRTVLTLAQCAGAAALVVLAVVLTRSFIKLTSVDLGWDASRVLSLNVSLSIPPDLRRPWYRYVEWSDRVVARLEATPGVARAAFTTQVPLSPQSFSSTLARGRGKAAGDDIRWPDVQHNVTDGYFDVMGIRLIRGRTFQGSDRFTESQLTSPNPVDRGVVIVSESTARALWPGRSALGEALRLPVSDFTARWREVVGVVEDIQFYAVGEKPALHVFVPWTQLSTGGTGGPRLVVKGERDDASLVDTVRSAVRSVEPGTRIVRVERLDALVSRATAQPRFASRVVSLFGALALLLAAVGIYGTLSYLIGARTREIGVRLALGAPRHQVLARTVAGGLVPAIAGGLLGLPIAWALGRLFPTLLFEVAPDDAASSIAGAMVLVLVACVAASLAARRATHVNALAALRTE
jgi:putative ABC transport system permease protein